MVSTNKVEFATFMLEPTGDFFIVTIGPNDPPVPPISLMNSNIEMLQLRTKSVEKSVSITKLTVKVPVLGDYVKFGEENGIEQISLWIDSNKDGKGDVKIAESDNFDSKTNSVDFDTFLSPLNYLAGEEKYLVVNVDFEMVCVEDGYQPMAGKIEIPVNGLKVSDPDITVVDLPVRSKKFEYDCGNESYSDNDEQNDDEFYDDESDDDSDGDVVITGCGCSVI